MSVKTNCLSLAIVLLAGASAATAEMCTLDPAPAATLLLPYFEVDLENPGGVTTLLTLNNDRPEPALVHITLWTDWGQPTIDFPVFLTGYDVAPINLRDVFEGNLPVTADEQTDPADLVSPHGQNPSWDGSFPGCEDFFPYSNPVIPGLFLERLRNGHTGRDVLGEGCLGEDHGDDIARGYVTFDNVTRCALFFPSDPEFFAAGEERVASDVNQLWGQYYLVDQANDSAVGDALVEIEADPELDGESTATGYTFYGRYSGGADHREPLATHWQAPYLSGGAFDGGTDLLVWRDTSSAEVGGYFECGVGPQAFPLFENEVIVFDEEETAFQLCIDNSVITPPPPVDPCLPLATQRAAVGQHPLATHAAAGWILLNLNNYDADGPLDVDFGAQGTIVQSHVSAVSTAAGLFQVGFAAQPRASACDDVDRYLSFAADIGIW